jgi:hypothetical protein
MWPSVIGGSYPWQLTGDGWPISRSLFARYGPPVVPLHEQNISMPMERAADELKRLWGFTID